LQWLTEIVFHQQGNVVQCTAGIWLQLQANTLTDDDDDDDDDDADDSAATATNDTIIINFYQHHESVSTK